MVSASTPAKLDSKPVTLHGKLVGRSGSAQTIVIAAHYDSSAAVPVSLPYRIKLNYVIEVYFKGDFERSKKKYSENNFTEMPLE